MDKGVDTIRAMVIKGIEHGRFEIKRTGSQEPYISLDVNMARNESLRLCHDAGLASPELVRTIDRLLDHYIDRKLQPRSARRDLTRA
jgi:hypothetical protein